MKPRITSVPELSVLELLGRPEPPAGLPADPRGRDVVMKIS
jgi:hypothetical protein